MSADEHVPRDRRRIGTSQYSHVSVLPAADHVNAQPTGLFKFANHLITSRSACTQEKVQGLETQVQQLQEQLQAVQLENVHDAAQLQVGRSVAVLQTLCEASGTRTTSSAAVAVATQHPGAAMAWRAEWPTTLSAARSTMLSSLNGDPFLITRRESLM